MASPLVNSNALDLVADNSHTENGSRHRGSGTKSGVNGRMNSREFSPGLVTIFCDVSFCPNTKAAGYGAWYRRDGMEKGVFFGEPIPVPCQSSNDGEFWGVTMALRRVFKELVDVSTVVLQCDNLNALSWLREFHPNAAAVGEHHNTHGIPQSSRSYPRSMATAIAIVRAMSPSVRIWLKHVKGHDNKSKTARSWVNKQCDSIAREQMTAHRGRIRRPGPLQERV
ncbi:hypothetical protein GOB57_22230 [Sinorhizobium meliloti]|nr:hypothetical protein [Sinorhizobium meliloti]